VTILKNKLTTKSKINTFKITGMKSTKAQ